MFWILGFRGGRGEGGGGRRGVRILEGDGGRSLCPWAPGLSKPTCTQAGGLIGPRAKGSWEDHHRIRNVPAPPLGIANRWMVPSEQKGNFFEMDRVGPQCPSKATKSPVFCCILPRVLLPNQSFKEWGHTLAGKMIPFYPEFPGA